MLSVEQKKAIIKFVIRVISCARKITFPSLMNTTKAIRKNIRLMVGLGMKMNMQRKALLGKVGFSLILIVL